MRDGLSKRGFLMLFLYVVDGLNIFMVIVIGVIIFGMY